MPPYTPITGTVPPRRTVSNASTSAASNLTKRAEADDDDRAAVGDVGEIDGLPGGRQHVGQVDVTVVRQFVADFDRPEIGMSDTEQLSLAAGCRPVQFGEAEQGGAFVLFGDLGRFALGEQLTVAHETVSAPDVERHHDPISDVQVSDFGAHSDNGTHGFVPEDVAFVQEHGEYFVEVRLRRLPDLRMRQGAQCAAVTSPLRHSVTVDVRVRGRVCCTDASVSGNGLDRVAFGWRSQCGGDARTQLQRRADERVTHHAGRIVPIEHVPPHRLDRRDVGADDLHVDAT